MVNLVQNLSIHEERMYNFDMFCKLFIDFFNKDHSFFSKLREINPWHFLWISILAAEILTAIITTITSHVLWGKVSRDDLLIGAVDSFLVSLVVVLPVIYFINQIRIVKVVNEQLIQEIEERKKAEADKKHFKISFNSLSGWRLLAVWLEEWRMILIIFCR